MSDHSPDPARLSFRAGIGGEPIVSDIHATPALAFEPAPWGAWVVTSGGHPVAGDRLDVRVEVGVGCCAELRSYSPTVARSTKRPRKAAVSSTRTHVSVASDGMLTWVLEPGIGSDGSNHVSDSLIQLASNARLLWREEFLLERRFDEKPGTWRSRLRVTRDSWPVICTDLAIGPVSPLWESPAVLNGAGAVSLVVVVDPGQGASEWSSTRTTVGSATGMALPLSTPGIQLLAWGDDLVDCREAVERMLPACGVAPWVEARWHGEPGPVVPGLGGEDHLVVGGDAGLSGSGSRYQL
ncbi:MAG: urease accessory protein UreD [Acidimicrobiales bacterium]|nr:urease accessory protein UreD [Acidimicrobiales bacterium]